ncbi:MAG: DUF881 domain-containing protein [Bacillota bacterium]
MRKWLVPITLVCIISGFFLAFQLKVQASNTTINPLSQKNTNLVTIIKDLEKEIKIQENQIERTRNDLNALQNRQSSRKLQELKNQLDKLKIMAGLTPVVGNGIIIVIDDNKAGLKANPNDDPNKYIVHYEHILNLVSELKVGGAEAISVNGQRLITTSEIRCVGNVILVNTTRIAPPFEIRAIGSPKLLAEIVTNGELELLKSSNYPVTLQEETELIIPAYKGELQFNYSQPGKEG